MKKEMERCLFCRIEISDKTVKENKGRVCDSCTAEGDRIEKSIGMS